MPARPDLEPRKDSDALSNSGVHQKILDATVDLFVEAGYGQVTTNLIAERAGISVGSVYRFYPNKFAIFNAVVQNFFTSLDQALDEFLQTADPDAPWHEQIDRLSDRWGAVWQENRTLIRAWGVLGGNPEIAKLDGAYAAKSTDRLAGYLHRIAPGRSPAQYTTMARLIYSSTLAVFDAATLSPDAFGHEIVSEYKAMLKAYLRASAPRD